MCYTAYWHADMHALLADYMTIPTLLQLEEGSLTVTRKYLFSRSVHYSCPITALIFTAAAIHLVYNSF